jgi:hypothetical protein
MSEKKEKTVSQSFRNFSFARIQFFIFFFRIFVVEFQIFTNFVFFGTFQRMTFILSSSFLKPLRTLLSKRKDSISNICCLFHRILMFSRFTRRKGKLQFLQLRESSAKSFTLEGIREDEISPELKLLSGVAKKSIKKLC